MLNYWYLYYTGNVLDCIWFYCTKAAFKNLFETILASMLSLLWELIPFGLASISSTICSIAFSLTMIWLTIESSPLLKMSWPFYFLMCISHAKIPLADVMIVESISSVMKTLPWLFWIKPWITESFDVVD